MSDAASRLYPSANPTPAVEAPASDAASRLYPSANPIPAAEAPQRAPSAPEPVKSPAASPPSPSSPQSQGAAQGVPPEPPPIDGADAIFSAPMPSPQSVQDIMRLPDDPDAAGFGTGPEDIAQRQEAASALHAAGLSRAEVGTAWDYAVRSAHSGYVPPDADTTLAALRMEWGTDYDTKLAAAQEFMREIYRRSPAIKAHVLNTGLASDLAFVRAVAAAATRRGAR